MKILLHATGEDRNLSPLTDCIAPALLPILNRPVMAYALEMLGRQQLKDVHVSLYDRPAEIEAYFGDGRQRGFAIQYHLQKEAWGDAGAVRWALQASQEPVLLLPADRLIDLDCTAAAAFQQAHPDGITLILAKAPPGYHAPVGCQLDGERITGLGPADPDGWVSTGVCILSPAALEKIPPRRRFSVLDDLIPALLAEGVPVWGWRFEGYWNPLASFTQYYEAQFKICAGKPSGDLEAEPAELQFITREGGQHSQGVWMGKNNAIHPRAQIAPQVYLHQDNRIEKDVQLGPDVVVGRGVVIDQAATIDHSIILDHTYIGRLLNVAGKVVYKTMVIDIATGEHITLTDPFLLAENRTEQMGLSITHLGSVLAGYLLLILLLPVLLLIGLYLAICGSPVIRRLACLHTDFRWFVGPDAARLRPFSLYQFDLRNRRGAYVPGGRWMEARRLHRALELFNLVNGDLAIVGVKPLPAEIAAGLHEEWQQTRFTVPAGIVGLWLLQSGDQAELDQVLIADAYYAATRSFKEDLKLFGLIFKTWAGRFFRR